jgi:cytochrome bd-type quinol oxidase subunit 2
MIFVKLVSLQKRIAWRAAVASAKEGSTSTLHALHYKKKQKKKKLPTLTTTFLIFIILFILFSCKYPKFNIPQYHKATNKNRVTARNKRVQYSSFLETKWKEEKKKKLRTMEASKNSDK